MANQRQVLRAKRKKSIRKKLKGTAERPRLTVFKSQRNIYAQIIDDEKGATLVSASTKCKELLGGSANLESAKKVGTLLAEKAKSASVAKVVFDRNGFLYHGSVKALADAAREAGLEF